MIRLSLPFFLSFALLLSFGACDKSENRSPATNTNAILLVIDEESIDNGNEPNNFSQTDVNDQLAAIGLRTPLQYFADNAGKTIDLYTGQVGDEGWHALKTIPNTWINAGPTVIGAQNFLAAGPGLGTGNPDDNREVLLDKIPDVVPLRAEGLSMLIGQTVLAVVYDSEVSTNYSPLTGNLMGANLGIIAFDVLEVIERTDGSSSSLPRVKILIRDLADVAGLTLSLFANAPIPESSSEPFDITPPATIPPIEVTTAP